MVSPRNETLNQIEEAIGGITRAMNLINRSAYEGAILINDRDVCCELDTARLHLASAKGNVKGGWK